MARLNVQNERVQRLINKRVVPLFLAYGSIAALTKALNDALRSAGLEGTLHPNRLHTLLSNDVSRGLNEATIQLTEEAAEHAFEQVASIPEQATSALDDLKREASRLHLFAGATVDEVGQRLGVPSAVADKLLSSGTAMPAQLGSPALLADEASDLRQLPPDWSYQDTAVARCVEAFGRRPTGRIGLILPTGAGKTRTALRIVLTMLDKSSDPKAHAYWVTHRRNLREQAYRELQKLIAAGHEQISAERLTELANRIKFVMVGDLTPLLEGAAVKPALIVVDEAHHAAAPSYRPVFANPWRAPVLLLTATPNRSDSLPIGIDEIAFTITYRELAERRAILTPKFLDFPVDNFDWSPEAVDDLAVVVEDLAAGREDAPPIRLAVKGVLVEVRGHVAAQARVVVPVPGPTDLLALLEDQEVVVAGPLQGDAHRDAGHAGADDHHAGAAGRLGHAGRLCAARGTDLESGHALRSLGGARPDRFPVNRAGSGPDRF